MNCIFYAIILDLLTENDNGALIVINTIKSAQRAVLWGIKERNDQKLTRNYQEYIYSHFRIKLFQFSASRVWLRESSNFFQKILCGHDGQGQNGQKRKRMMSKPPL